MIKADKTISDTAHSYQQGYIAGIRSGKASQLEEIIAMVRDWGKMLKGGSNEWLVDDLVEKLNLMKGENDKL